LVIPSIRVASLSARYINRAAGLAKPNLLFHGKRHPSLLGAEEIGNFLTHLAVKRTVSASTQNQALAALLFLYKQVLHIDLPRLEKSSARKETGSAGKYSSPFLIPYLSLKILTILKTLSASLNSLDLFG